MLGKHELAQVRMNDCNISDSRLLPNLNGFWSSLFVKCEDSQRTGRTVQERLNCLIQEGGVYFNDDANKPAREFANGIL